MYAKVIVILFVIWKLRFEVSTSAFYDLLELGRPEFRFI